MLILADADGFGINLDQFGERILQAARDGDGSANGEIEIGKLLARNVGSGVDAGAGLADRDGKDAIEAFARAACRGRRRSVSREAVPLPMAMARTLYFASSASSVARGSALPCFGGVQIDDVVSQELARLVNDRDLASGANAGIDAQH